MENKKASEREFAMYTFLQAMEKPETLEKFGFADVYYYTEWEGYYLLALSYFDSGDNPKEKKQFFKTDVGKDTINGLLLFKNFVSTFATLQSFRSIERKNVLMPYFF